ncbi:MAG: trehalase family glycosidase [Verrucomicrobiales bacterium]|nr:trehalase family glycosidase [Verrucomicrobiales bacterium]
MKKHLSHIVLAGLLAVFCCGAADSPAGNLETTVDIKLAGVWLAKATAGVTPVESNLLQAAQSTLLGNVVKTNAWEPYRGIEPSSSTYRGIWNWDAAFHAVGVSHWDAELAREQLDIMFARQLTNGMLPDVIREDGRTITSCTKPPVMAWAVAVVDRRSPDQRYLQQIYPKLVQLEKFWLKERGGESDGLFYYAGSDVGYDSGWDNSMRWDNGYRKSPSDNHRLWAIDLNCYVYMQYRALSYLAGRLGRDDDRQAWLKKADTMARLINEKLWDEKTGFYMDRDRTTGAFSPTLSPAGFMPLFIHIAPTDRADQLVKISASQDKFYPGMPTAAYDTPEFSATNMWRGPAWLNTSYFAIKGLKDYGHAKLAETMRSTLLGWIDRDPASIREYYNPKTGDGLGAGKFGWSAVFTISFILDWKNDNLTWLFPET